MDKIPQSGCLQKLWAGLRGGAGQIGRVRRGSQWVGEGVSGSERESVGRGGSQWIGAAQREGGPGWGQWAGGGVRQGERAGWAERPWGLRTLLAMPDEEFATDTNTVRLQYY